MQDKDFNTVDEFIEKLPDEIKIKIREIRSIIKSEAPDAEEKISYGMPAYKTNGKPLVYFSVYKNHIGFYATPTGHEKFSAELSIYKQGKGSVQFPLDSPPMDLIRRIVRFRVEENSKLKITNDENLMNQYELWSNELAILKSIIEKTELTKAIKWGAEIYTFDSRNVVGIGGFKNYFTIWFYNGVFLQDKYKVLVNAQEGKTKSLRQWRFTSANEIDESRILEYLSEAIEVEKKGLRIKPEKFKAIEINNILNEALKNNIDLKTSFNKLTPGKQKEYIIYLNEAKQDKTKQTRLKKIIPMILQGIGLNDKYK